LANQLETSEDASGVTTYTFDAAGNQQLIQHPDDTRTTNTWDDENRLVTVQPPDGAITTSIFRSDGLRYIKVDADWTIKFIYDGQNYLVETDGSDITKSLYTNKPEQFGRLLYEDREE